MIKVIRVRVIGLELGLVLALEFMVRIRVIIVRLICRIRDTAV